MTEASARRAALALALILLTLIVFGGYSKPSTTDALWGDQQAGTASFESGTVGALENFGCKASNSLLTTRIRLDWDEPPGLEDHDVIYEISWDGSGLLAGSGSTETRNTEYTYVRTLLFSLAQFGVEFTVEPKIVGSNWSGDVSYAEARGAILLGGIGGLGCDAVPTD